MRTAPVSEGRVAAGGEDLSGFPHRRNPAALLRVVLARPAFEWAAALGAAARGEVNRATAATTTGVVLDVHDGRIALAVKSDGAGHVLPPDSGTLTRRTIRLSTADVKPLFAAAREALGRPA